MEKDLFIKINGEFIEEHYELEQTDYNIANKWIDIIEKTRTQKSPKPGDVLQLTNEHGDYFGFAHIDNYNSDGMLTVCERAYTPFCGRYIEEKNDVTFSTSGGAWCSVDPSLCKYVGTTQKKFCDWGHNGACAHGAIDFVATVNVWEYKAPNPKFGEYTTQFYKKQYITIQSEETMQKRQSNYKILGDGIAWETMEEYENFKKLYNAKEFPGYWGNTQKVLFTYKENRFYNTSTFQYESLHLPQYIILNNGSKYIAKVAKDDEQKQIFIYLCEDYKIKFDYSTEEKRKEYQNIKLYSKWEA